MITNQLLYQLSYAGIACHYAILKKNGQKEKQQLLYIH